MTLIDLVGKKFSKLLVISRGPDTVRKLKAPRWYCKCDCGNPELRLVEGGDLRRGTTVTCGCGGEGIAGSKNRIHGKSHTGIYSTYHGIHRRCYDEKCKDYKSYGGRGIKVCDRWHVSNEKGLENFVSDMGGTRPKGESIERIDVNGDYSPENCKWIPLKDQSKNTRIVTWLRLAGEKMSLSEASRRIKVTPGYLKFHLDKGNNPDFVMNYVNRQRMSGKMLFEHKWEGYGD